MWPVCAALPRHATGHDLVCACELCFPRSPPSSWSPPAPEWLPLGHQVTIATPHRQPPLGCLRITAQAAAPGLPSQGLAASGPAPSVSCLRALIRTGKLVATEKCVHASCPQGSLRGPG
jgi:hypothetical protein